MNDTDIEEMMGQFNVDDVLNDPTLNAELMELAGEQGVSFQQSTIPAKPPKPPKSATEMIQKENAVATAGSISLEDIETIGIVDESQMELTDADMNDPDLLSQLAILQVSLEVFSLSRHYLLCTAPSVVYFSDIWYMSSTLISSHIYRMEGPWVLHSNHPPQRLK